MATQNINPFNELYVTETIAPEQFVALFSPRLIEHAFALFQPGNVVVRGVQGSGKSMLLNLLRPDVCIAYHKAGMAMPVPEKLRSFVGAGINITRSAAIDFGQRPIEPDPDDDDERLPHFFGDFVNYWVVVDILHSIKKLSSECNGVIGHHLGLSASTAGLDAFASMVSLDPCWFGYLDGISDYKSLESRLQERIGIYRRFLNYNIDELPRAIRNSKTSIGQPISRFAAWLHDCQIVPKSVPFFVRIDQYEELSRLEDWNKELGLRYRRIINKLLGKRDPRVFYRIGTRRYAWQDDQQIYGTTSKLELERDYKIVDLEDILRRKENRETWIFPGFAEDVFERRLRYAGYVHQSQSKGFLRTVFGDGHKPSELARHYVKEQSLPAGVTLPEAHKETFANFSHANPLAARLVEAWCLQRKLPELKPEMFQEPFRWTKYWQKERIQLALMQIAADKRQRMIWGGTDDILHLSGGNILVFVSLSQHIWAAWIRSIRERAEDTSDSLSLPVIQPSVQAVGIHLTSTHWYNKIPEQTGHSHRRQRFVDFLGKLFRQRMTSDRSMSYPGHNGFSVRTGELEAEPDVRQFLDDAVDYGDLFDAPHTTKMQDGRQRRKWYLNPILSPYFQIPETHVKEPIYVTVVQVLEWISLADLSEKPPRLRDGGRANPDFEFSDSGQMVFSMDGDAEAEL